MVYSTRRFVLCYFVLVFSAITSLGEERANLSAARTVVRFALASWCLRRRFVIVALPGFTFFLYSILLACAKIF